MVKRFRNGKRVISCGLVFLLTFLVCFSYGYKETYAASGSLSIALSAQTVTTGQTVTVTVRMSADEPIGYTVGVNYDASKLEYQGGADGGGGGRVDLVSEGDGTSSSFSRSITFKAIATGSASISASGSYGGYNSFSSITPAAAGATITVNAPQAASDPNSGNSSSEEKSGSGDNALKSLEISPGTLSPAFSSSTYAYTVELPEDAKSIVVSAVPNDSKAKVSVSHNNDLEPGANKTYIVVTAENGTQKTYILNVNCGEVSEEEANGIKILGKQYQFATADQMKDVEIPEGFAEGKLDYQGNEIIVYKTEDEKVTLVYLLNETGEGGWFIYFSQHEEFIPYVEFSGSGRYVFLTPDESVTAPEGYQVSEFEIGGQTIYGFANPEFPEYYLVYAMPFGGDAGLYFFDSKEKTLQRYHAEKEVVETVTGEAEPEIIEPPVTEDEKVHNLKRLLYISGGVLVLLLAGWIVSLMIQKERVRKAVLEELDREDAE